MWVGRDAQGAALCRRWAERSVEIVIDQTGVSAAIDGARGVETQPVARQVIEPGLEHRDIVEIPVEATDRGAGVEHEFARATAQRANAQIEQQPRGSFDDCGGRRRLGIDSRIDTRLVDQHASREHEQEQ